MDEDRRKRLREAVFAALDPELDAREPFSVFLPLWLHERLLEDRVVVLQGERGAGKTALFRFLAALQDQRAAWSDVFPKLPVGSRSFIAGFEEQGKTHPSTQAVVAWAASQPRERLEQFWLAHLFGCLSARYEAPQCNVLTEWRGGLHEPERWVACVPASLGLMYAWFDKLDHEIQTLGQRVLVGYDDLDRLTTGGDLEAPGLLAEALVSLWLRFSRRFSALQGKIFLRPDLLAQVLTSATDASKLRGHAAELKWSAEDVFRVLLRRLGSDEGLREHFGAAGLRFERHTLLGWMPPYALPEIVQLDLFRDSGARDVDSTRGTQRAVARCLAGETMGTGANKGYTHNWILNHTQDGRGQSLPRVTLNLIRNAAAGAIRRARQANDLALFAPSDLEEAQVATGQQRLEELRESHPVVSRLENLRGLTVPALRQEMAERLAMPRPGHRDDFGDDGATVLRRLVELGTLVERPAGKGQPAGAVRVDLPDLFRRPLDIARKGGPLQIRPGGI